jgi:hypothetical protein
MKSISFVHQEILLPSQLFGSASGKIPAPCAFVRSAFPAPPLKISKTVVCFALSQICDLNHRLAAMGSIDWPEPIWKYFVFSGRIRHEPADRKHRLAESAKKEASDGRERKLPPLQTKRLIPVLIYGTVYV